MIIGIGTDIVDVDRIGRILARHGRRFTERCFTAEEIRVSESRSVSGATAASYAKRFAAKEACAKALGIGFSKGVFLTDIGVFNDDAGKPYLQLSRGAQARLEELTPEGTRANVHLSLTDDPPVAVAFVIIEATSSFNMPEHCLQTHS